MCGICGFTGISDQQLLHKMADTIYHRGPDEDGYYSDGQVNLGMRRLSIIDLLSGQQPVHNEDKSIWVVFNGEIYNFGNLRKDLILKGHKFYTDHSDTEVLVHLYEEYGVDFVHELNGMFAIALWDKKTQKLVLTRDRMGVKPLFYSKIKDKLVFASEIKAILKHPDYNKKENFDALYHYFSFKNIPAPLTAFKDIYSLLPGEILTFEGGRLDKKRYWKIKFNENKFLNEEETKEKILDILQDSVKVRMISDVPYGAYLSGGVDSSAVVAIMSRISDKPIKTFTLGYEDDLKNKLADLHFAREVSKMFNTEHHEYIMTYKELTEDIDKVLEAFDQPFSGTISTFFLSKLISKHVKVAISGDGADELFGSYLAHRLAQPMDAFSRHYAKYCSGQLVEEEKLELKPFDTDIEYLKGLYEESRGDIVKWRNSLLTFNDNDKSKYLSNDFLSSTSSKSTFEWLKKYFDNGSTIDPLNRILEVDWNSLLPDQVLAFVDFLSMAHSVEVRSPFLDYRLVEFVSTIPGAFKIRNGNVKDILKSTVEGIISKEITRRPKEGFVLPVFDWLKGPLKGYMLELLSKDRINKHGFFNEEEVSNLVISFTSGDNKYNAKLWNLMMFQIWWEKYFG